ncbi:hypothetical protein CGCA056_v014053 [Colletotrichum aenigma]|uniref:uncharacterized protein n=1 Tax=Colletotrichum aenigma TaxID=1215731 RepID=UPI0018733108|nr:uncharacterized protein CGCA056_v014053 [Colletotrichum aenigma]KAF5501937.1 hypothetical protein CGCA056_v014053 [Colletotrichum aenigma]
MRYFFALATLITAALAVAISEPQGKCNPDFNCCTFSESACSERLQACTRTCNGVTTKGICNDLGAGSLTCDAA